MAVPTINTITPNSGTSIGRQMIEILGTDFRLPDPPPSTGPTPTPVPTVSVEFGAIPSGQVLVTSGTRLFARSPKFELLSTEANSAVDVVITNLDNTGTPIPGETVTAVGGFTYARPDISAENESLVTRAVRSLLRLLKSEVIPNVIHEQDPDYDDDISTPFTAHTELPALSIIGPDLDENRFFSFNSNSYDTELTGGGVLIQRPSYMVDLTFDIVGYSDNDVEFLNLLSLCTQWKDRNQTIAIPCDFNDLNAGSVELDFRVPLGGDFKVEKQVGNTANSGLKVFRGQVLIQALPLGAIEGISQDNANGATTTVAEDGLVIEQIQQTGNNPLSSITQAHRGPVDC